MSCRGESHRFFFLRAHIICAFFLVQFTPTVFIILLGFFFFSKRDGKRQTEFLIKPFTKRACDHGTDHATQFCCVCLQTNIYEQIVGVGRARGDGKHGRVCVVLEAGQTDGWTDAWIDGWMDEVGVARGGTGGLEKGDKRAIEGGNSGQNLAIKAENLREEG